MLNVGFLQRQTLFREMIHAHQKKEVMDDD